MKFFTMRVKAYLVLSAILLFGSTATRAQKSIWVTAYYAGWMQGYLTPQNIDYGAVTHIIHFALVPQADGTLNETGNSVTASSANALITPAHAAGKKVIISVGGWASEDAFVGATNSTNRPVFISNLVNLMKSRAYDGIDIDWEPLSTTNAAQYTAFITELRSALDGITPRPLLTAAVAWGPSIVAQVGTKFDQINIMTYDMSGAWPGWVTWHNSPVYDGGLHFPGLSKLVPSANALVDDFVSAGVPVAKLGIGIDFYGYVWSGGAGTPNGGATAPGQSWTTAPAVQANVPFFTIMTTYYQSQYERWDTSAQASYLSIDNTGSANDKFVSYDNAKTCGRKIEYARAKGIGGVIIWELGGGYRADQPAGQRDQLLQAVKQALGGTTILPDTIPPVITITSPSNGATVASTVTVSAAAGDNECVGGVQFLLNGGNLGNEVSTAPYTVSWNSSSVSNGSYTISAVARDTSGNSAKASITVIVSNTAPPPPTVAITSPVNGAKVNGTLTVAATASGTLKLLGVQFKLDGYNLGSEVTTGPYLCAWNTTQVADGAHTVTAIARDSAGNQATASAGVIVSNNIVGSPSLWVYQNGVQSPWNNASWNAALTFNSTEQMYSGANSIKVVQGLWGGLSLHSGYWNAPVPVNPSQYQSVDFAIFGGVSGASIAVILQNDIGNSFPRIKLPTIRRNTWKSVSIPMSQLDPGGFDIHRVSIMEISRTPGTYYVASLRFVGNSVSTGPHVVSASATEPGCFSLMQNYPNPFNPSTAITYSLAEDAHVTLEVYNTLGQSVAALVNDIESSGEHQILYDASNLPSGVYFYRITAVPVSGDQAGVFVAIKRMALIK